ncbi:PIR protein, partial [Plasmodium vivax]
MAAEDKIYTVSDFAPQNILQISNLDKTNIIRLYKAFFEEKCNIHYDFYSKCVSDGSEKTLPPNLSELYKKFERNIKLIQDQPEYFSNWEKDKEKLCFYLKYWIYDQLISKNITDDAFSKFINLWNEQKEEKCPSCECEFKIKSFSLVKHLKKAYDYFLFLNAYNDTKTISTHIADKNYCKYIDGSKTVYSLYPLICKGGITENCKEFEKYILPYMKNDDENSILCESESTYEPDEEGI